MVALNPIRILPKIFTGLLVSLQSVRELCQEINGQHKLLVSQLQTIARLLRRGGCLGSNVEALQVEKGVYFPRFMKLPYELQDMIVSP